MVSSFRAHILCWEGLIKPLIFSCFESFHALTSSSLHAAPIILLNPVLYKYYAVYIYYRTWLAVQRFLCFQKHYFFSFFSILFLLWVASSLLMKFRFKLKDCLQCVNAHCRFYIVFQCTFVFECRSWKLSFSWKLDY